MLLSLEIPTAHLNEFLPLTDFGFGLAHLMVKDHGYTAAMQGCLLDNSMYELGEPLSIEDLITAALLCQPIALVAPDWEDDMGRTISAAYECLEASRGHGWTVGALVQGRNLEERVQCFKELQQMHIRPIGFPFRSPRDKTIVRLLTENRFREGEWYHLFGLRAMDELSLKLPGKWSVDTGKPFKGFRIDQGPIRGHGKLRLHEPLAEKAHKAALWNIAYMRKEMQ